MCLLLFHRFSAFKLKCGAMVSRAFFEGERQSRMGVMEHKGHDALSKTETL